MTQRRGLVLLGAAAAALVAVSMPVVWRGAPLADDFNNCLAPQELGLGGFIASSWERLGMVRPARFVEILVTTGVCQSLPFGVAILVPLALTLAVAWLAYGLLRDLGADEFWAGAAGALWLLQPLGGETALWPAALHVPLGLAAALAALRLYRRGRLLWAAAATAAAFLSVEQVILALPVAVWLIAPPGQRRRAAAISAVLALATLAAFVLWPGTDPRLQAGLVERIAQLGSDPVFYLAFPAVGLGLGSIPLAARWALPWSVAVLAAGAACGAATARWVRAGAGTQRHDLVRGVAGTLAVVVLCNVPVVLAVPRQGSPRLFTPTWLVLAIAVALLGDHVRWRRPAPVLAAGGLFAAGALLSLALSMSVRVESADFTEQAAHAIAERVADGSQVAVCDVPRTVTRPAPRGAFAVHDFIYPWAAENAVLYYTGERITFRLAGELWDDACPSPGETDVVLSFDELRAESQP